MALPGRPVAFDRERALDRAMRVFWKKGYEGASLRDLTAAMNIRAPSLYAAFGNKQKLFEAAVQRYVSGPGAYLNEALREPTAYAVAERILRETAEFLTGPGGRNGCMTIQGGMAGGDESRCVRRKLAALRLQGQDELRRRFVRAQKEGDLPKTVDAADLARFVSTVFQGMTVQAMNGATREEQRRVAEMALRAWPG
jgi:AcrR family transcriptional regulator